MKAKLPNLPRPLRSFVPADLASTLLNVLTTVDNGLIQVVGKTGAGSTVFATSLASEISDVRNAKVDYVAPIQEYGKPSWRYSTDLSDVSVTPGNIVIYDRHTPDALVLDMALTKIVIWVRYDDESQVDDLDALCLIRCERSDAFDGQRQYTLMPLQAWPG